MPRNQGEARVDDVGEENIYLFWPNIIGYARIVLAICSLSYMPLHPRRCSGLYAISCLLDAADGYAARYFRQSTLFGGVLDMMTDRCTTTCLLVFLAIANPAWAPLFQGLICLDFASHYMHMYATLATGARGGSHKDISAQTSWILNFYYKKPVLFTTCALNELFFIGLYLLCFSSSEVSTPFFSSEIVTSTLQHLLPEWVFTMPQFRSAAMMEAARINKLNDQIPWIVVGVGLPGMLFKQFTNILQLQNACQRLTHEDRLRRRWARQERAR